VQIVQTYLRSDPDHEVRIRKRGNDDDCLYYLTDKRMVHSRRRLMTQRRLTASEYHMLLSQADPNKREIRKTRYCLTFQGQYFEIDLFPCWDDQAMVEIELSSEDTPVVFPEQIKVIREVTGDPRYRNSTMASKPQGATH
jgi:CYTH domain-containing protein